MKVVAISIIFLYPALLCGQYKNVMKKEIAEDTQHIDFRLQALKAKFWVDDSGGNKRRTTENENVEKAPQKLKVPVNAKGKTFKVSAQEKQRSRVFAPAIEPRLITNGFTALIDNNDFTPPDCAGAVGESHIMTALNTE